jgi:hypothetical protein
MWPTLVSLRGVPITWWGLFWITAIIWASFVIWRKMREDNISEEIFSLTVWLAAAALVGRAADSMGVAVATVAVLWWWCRRKEWDFWESLDFLAVVGLWLWLGGSLAWGPGAKWDLSAAVLGIILAWYIRENYRKFRWYASGKVGLVGLFSLLFFSLSQEMIALFTPTNVYWEGLTINQLIASWVIAFSLVAIYIRSGRSPREDMNWLLKHKYDQPQQKNHQGSDFISG